jgi:hypothetical protein
LRGSAPFILNSKHCLFGNQINNGFAVKFKAEQKLHGFHDKGGSACFNEQWNKAFLGYHLPNGSIIQIYN